MHMCVYMQEYVPLSFPPYDVIFKYNKKLVDSDRKEKVYKTKLGIKDIRHEPDRVTGLILLIYL